MFKRIICMVIALVMTVSVCACQKENNKSESSASAGDTGLYEEKEIGKNSGIKTLGEARVNSKNQLVAVDKQDEKKLRFVTLDADGKPVGEIKCSINGTLDTFFLDSKDNIVASISESTADSKKLKKIIEIDASGKILNSVDLGTYTSERGQWSIQDMAVDGSGNIYLATMDGIRMFDKSGKELRKIGSGLYFSLTLDVNNNIFATSMSDSQYIEKLDASNGQGIWKTDISDASKSSDGAMVFSGGAKLRYDASKQNLCLMNDSGISRYDISGKMLENTIEFKKYIILSSGNIPCGFNVDQKGDFYVVTSKEQKFELYKYGIGGGAKKDENTKVLTIAVPVSEKWLEIAAAKFKSQNPGFKVEIKAYEQEATQDRNYENFKKCLNTELLTGKAPDIIATSDLPYEKYIQKNIFADLSELIAKDKSFDASKYYSNIFDALKYKDRLYTLPTSVTFDALAANKGVLDKQSLKIDDNSWTWKTLKEIGQQLNQNNSSGTAERKVFNNISAGKLLKYMLQANYSSFVNVHDKKASFDSAEFVELLNIVKSFGDSKAAANKEWNDGSVSPDAIEKGNVIFKPETLSDFFGYAFIKALYKEQLKLLKYPSNGATGGNVFNSPSMYSINSHSQNKDAAWEFLKFLLSEEIQLEQQNVLAINKEALKISAQRVSDTIKGGGVACVVGVDGGKPVQLTPQPLKQEDIDYINGFMENMKVFNNLDGEVKKIVQAEVESFFAGSKSAEDTAKFIQKKVNIYLGE